MTSICSQPDYPATSSNECGVKCGVSELGYLMKAGKHPEKALTAVQVRQLKEPGRYADGNGLYLVVDPSGAKRWLLRIVVRGRVDEDQIMCPTCGTVHENSFLNRFALVDDRESCRDFILSTTQEYERLGRDLNSARMAVAEVERDLIRVAEALNIRRGDVRLGEVLQSEGRRVAGEILVQRVRDFNQSIADLNNSLTSVAEGLKAISAKSKRQEIEQYYFARMSANLARLNVKTVPLSTVEKIDSRVRDTGSDQPRALLAYDFAVFDTIRRYSTSFIAPMVIDSPIQQDQDDQNARLMLEFIAEKASSKEQVVLGTVSMHGVDIGDGSLIELTEPLSLLQSSDYEQIAEEFNEFFEAVT